MLEPKITSVADCDPVLRRYFSNVWETTGNGEIHRYYERETGHNTPSLLITYHAEHTDLTQPIARLKLNVGRTTLKFSQLYELRYREENDALEFILDVCSHQCVFVRLTNDIQAAVQQHPRIASDDNPTGR